MEYSSSRPLRAPILTLVVVWGCGCAGGIGSVMPDDRGREKMTSVSVGHDGVVHTPKQVENGPFGLLLGATLFGVHGGIDGRDSHFGFGWLAHTDLSFMGSLFGGTLSLGYGQEAVGDGTQGSGLSGVTLLGTGSYQLLDGLAIRGGVKWLPDASLENSWIIDGKRQAASADVAAWGLIVGADFALSRDEGKDFYLRVIAQRTMAEGEGPLNGAGQQRRLTHRTTSLGLMLVVAGF